AGHAGRDAALGVAAVEQLLADLVELHAGVWTGLDLGVVGDAGVRLLGGVVDADVAHFLPAELLRKRFHYRALALAGLEQGQLVGHVALALPAHGGVHVAHRALAVHAVAGGAGGGQGGTVLRVAPGGVGEDLGDALGHERGGVHRRFFLQRHGGGLGVGDGGGRQGGQKIGRASGRER